MDTSQYMSSVCQWSSMDRRGRMASLYHDRRPGGQPGGGWHAPRMLLHCQSLVVYSPGGGMQWCRRPLLLTACIHDHEPMSWLVRSCTVASSCMKNNAVASSAGGGEETERESRAVLRMTFMVVGTVLAGMYERGCRLPLASPSSSRKCFKLNMTGLDRSAGWISWY